MLSINALSSLDVQQKLKNDNTFSGILDKYNKSINLNINFKENGKEYVTKSNHQKQFVLIGKAIAILTFDFISSSKYQNSINHTKEFQFLRHLRNGAAHYNTFNLKNENGSWKIRKNEIIEWKNKKIDRSLQGKEIFPTFFNLLEMFFLAYDLSNKLLMIDSNKKTND